MREGYLVIIQPQKFKPPDRSLLYSPAQYREWVARHAET
jgi:hypothetical protein